MGNDTLSAKNRVGQYASKLKDMLMKAGFIVPAEEEKSEPVEYSVRQTNIPRRTAAFDRPNTQIPQRGNRAGAVTVRQGRQNGNSRSLPEKKVDTAVFFVDSLASCTHAIRAIISGTSVIVHFINTDRGTAQRIIDTLSGAAFALNAKIKKVEDSTYFIAPNGTNINVVHPNEKRY